MNSFLTFLLGAVVIVAPTSAVARNNRGIHPQQKTQSKAFVLRAMRQDASEDDSDVTLFRDAAMVEAALAMLIAVGWWRAISRYESLSSRHSEHLQRLRDISLAELQAKEDQLADLTRRVESLKSECAQWKHLAHQKALEAQMQAARLQFTPEQLRDMLSDS